MRRFIERFYGKRRLALLVLQARRRIGRQHVWLARATVLAFAALCGIVVVIYVGLTDLALAAFAHLREGRPWLPLVWTPLCTGLIVAATRAWAPGAAGSGIPQVMAALEGSLGVSQRRWLVSLRLALAKMLLSAWGLLGGLSLGREGPSVQIAAGIMHAARRWLPARAPVSGHGLLVAGGAAGISAAFNAPLAGVMFAIEELARGPEQRSNGLIISAIVLSGLIAVSVFGNNAYFGVLQAGPMSWSLLLPGLLVAAGSGLAGASFSRLLLHSLAGGGNGPLASWRRARPVSFAAACGLGVAILGVATDGATFGSGYAHSKAMLAAGESEPLLYVAMKYLATWLTAWSGVPGGIFAPSLAIGGALGNDLAVLAGQGHSPTLIALGMAGFLAAATQAPLTAFIIVMEMVDGHAMVLSLMACTLVASAISRLASPPLYRRLAQAQLALAREQPAAPPSAG